MKCVPNDHQRKHSVGKTKGEKNEFSFLRTLFSTRHKFYHIIGARARESVKTVTEGGRLKGNFGLQICLIKDIDWMGFDLGYRNYLLLFYILKNMGQKIQHFIIALY